ncbi:GNAT family N-acetyltransferase [Lapidilactobacillus wuchangensis]|uniref:GNAT family N-acetyltransferase n=1 Tax=Lapidilactobacillus wuchangensis TaxID=2486001 RepID=UPI000F7A8001|nr:GNAT family N-acetyltransferase [Lapidilactobacillus wuchangensis]
MWQIKKTAALSSLELLAILKLRIDTFVVEQQRIYPEVDQNDQQAYHLFTTDPIDGTIIAYARVFIDQDDQLTFGRVLVNPRYRGHGWGNKLVAEILAFCQEHWPQRAIMIEAQVPVKSLYEHFGFVSQGQPFIFNHTPHVEMRYQAS